MENKTVVANDEVKVIEAEVASVDAWRALAESELMLVGGGSGEASFG